MRARLLDGASVTIAGRDFTAVDESPDEDGHGWFGFACDTCGESGNATWAEDHECPPACPHCGQRDEDARIETRTYKHSGDRYISWRCCGTDVECEHGRLLAECLSFHGEP